MATSLGRMIVASRWALAVSGFTNGWSLSQAGAHGTASIHTPASYFPSSGRPLFSESTTGHIELERIQTIAAPGVTHLYYRVVKGS